MALQIPPSVLDRRFTVRAGSVTFEAVPALLTVDGRALLYLEPTPGDEPVRLSADLYDDHGGHVAQLVRNGWTDGADRYELDVAPDGVTVTERDTGTVVAAISVADLDTIIIRSADLYTPTGLEVVVDPTGITIGGSPTISERTISGGTGVNIDTTELRID